MSARARLLLFAAGAAGCAALFTLGVLGLPGFGGAFHPYGDRAVRHALEEGTANAVASVTFDQRALDTVGEELILLASALAAVVLLRATGQERTADGSGTGHGPADVPDALRATGRLLLPPALVVGVYIAAHGHLSPGGGFQGGVVLGTAVHLLYLAGDYPALRRLRPLPLFEAAEALAAAAFVGVALAAAGLIPLLNTLVAAEVGCALTLLIAQFFDQALLRREPPEGRGRP
ncbi:MnhB domain-containing protein [Actinomadura algeriensis]|uniref:Multicomponent Na+:H+ antiporter subunit B n=1 Tax=Actinomadura algeriensis TaxID=1679523 RepID=A0ABR9K0J6_9ACTN|nr:MnhB domain-containing protein [Actinomadura algeriensis]MBE1536352.1 multicomponent Na+:H+ antiporter subunit B [Actinomadura algeriensis]